jgi:hypothetical protein
VDQNNDFGSYTDNVSLQLDQIAQYGRRQERQESVGPNNKTQGLSLAIPKDVGEVANEQCNVYGNDASI